MGVQNNKRRKKGKKKNSLLMPVLTVALMIGALTAGGVVLSVNQTKENPGISVAAKDDGESQNPKPSDSNSAVENPEEEKKTEAENAAENEPKNEAEELGSAVETEGLPTEDPGVTAYEDLKEQLRKGMKDSDTYLTVYNDEFETLRHKLMILDTSGFSEDQMREYEILLEYFNIEENGSAYKSYSAYIGRCLADVDNGMNYYNYLLKKLTGTGYNIPELHEMLVNEMNSNFEVVNGLIQNYPSDVEVAQSMMKQDPASAYLYSTVTAESDPLLTAMSTNGLESGWREFGLIRAYQMDENLSDIGRQYLINSTRMAYAMYGLLDISVHAERWNLDQVTNLCNQYFAGDMTDFAAALYQKILEKPGCYVAAGVGYLELTRLEAIVRGLTQDPSDQCLFDFFFRKGPTSFRMYDKWIEEMKDSGANAEESVLAGQEDNRNNEAIFG